MLPQQTDLKKNLIEGQREDSEVKRPQSRSHTPRKVDFHKTSLLAKLVTKNAIIKVEKEKIDREIYVEPTRWNKIKLFIANVYEVIILCLGLGLSIYQDDLISFVYQVFVLWLLYLAGRDMGRYIRQQHKINIVLLGLTILIWIAKYLYIKEVEPTLTETFEERAINLKTFGFSVQTADDGTITFNLYDCLEFETLAIFLSILLLIHYRGQIDRERTLEKFHYIHNSEWLSMNSILYGLFFIFIIADTLFSQTLIQMVVLAILLILLLLWAVDYDSNKLAQFLSYTVTWIRRLYTIQIALLAFAQIAYVIIFYKEVGHLYDYLFISGLILNEKPAYAALFHILIIGWILGFGQLFEVAYLNHKYYKEHAHEYLSHQLTENLLHGEKIARQKKEEEQARKKGIFAFSNDIVDYDYNKFINTYKPHLCLWGARICAIILSYAYHGIPSLISLSWVLISFMVPLYPFVSFTNYIYLPMNLYNLFFQFYVNTPGLYYNIVDFMDFQFINARMFENYGRLLNFPAAELGLMLTFTVFLIALMKYQNELKVQRDEIKIAIFTKFTDYRSNFLWQLFYYILKRIHIVLLSLIFVYGMKEINIYYIGLMYFFVVYTSSLVRYRESGRVLVLWAGFFIWIQYLWSLIKQDFDNTGDTYKLFTMVTLQKLSDDQSQKASQIDDIEDSLNVYMQYQIPVAQWLIFMLQVLMVSINGMFVPGEKPYTARSYESNQKKEFYSVAEFFEEKCDFVLRKKFPSSARFFIRLQMIFSEMMIISILIVQGFILTNQPANLMFWGFLILSLTLQTAVVSADEESESQLRRCANQSFALRMYSSIVLISQIAFHFIQDKSFLAQYGFDKLLMDALGPLTEYLPIFGFENYAQSTRSMFAIFVSQILFYITACILEDYFVERLQKHKQQQLIKEREKLGYGNLDDHHQTNEEGFVMQTTPSAFQRQSTKKKNVLDTEVDDEFLHQDDKEKILFEFERIRFTIPYMIYQRIRSWRFIDGITMNFYIVTAAVTIILATNWQISLFMAFYLICNVILCIRAAKSLHDNSHKLRNLESKEISVDEARRINKDYMFQANQTLLQVRTNQWSYQYWLLILSLIIMYPTPMMQDIHLGDQLQNDKRDQWVFWLFWSGIYVSKEQVDNFWSHAPLYFMLILLIFEKQAQRWQKDRYGCSLHKITHFKTIDEQMKLIQKGESPHPKQETSKIPSPELRIIQEEPEIIRTPYVTIQEAKQEKARIKSLFREQTPLVKENRLKKIIQLGLKRKYTIKLRSGMKVIMEQLSLFLLLLSCANKSNIISIIYLSVLLTFLLMKDKTSAMLIMSYVFGITLACEYLCTLTNLTSLSNPMQFPKPFDQGYPRITESSVQLPSSRQVIVSRELINEFPFPWFVQIPLLYNNLNWAHFFSIDIESTQVNDVWFDFANLIFMTIYFFAYGNPINAMGIKVSFSQTVSLEKDLDKYAKMQMKKRVYLKEGKTTEDVNYDDIERIDERHQVFPKKGEEPWKKSDMNLSFRSEDAADNSHEHFLGASYYLAELKKELFIYYFVRKSKYFVYIGLQILTLIMTFVLAIICRSFMSIGYMLFCVPLILSITDFFHLEAIKQRGETWKHPFLISGPLMYYCFADIALQVLAQTPFYHGDLLLRQFGFDKIYEINTSVSLIDLIYPRNDEFGNPIHNDFVSLERNGDGLFFLILKSLNLFHIFLQSRIYESDQFWSFIRVDLRRLINLANSAKKQALTFRYNNWKLQKIVTLQQKKRKMYEAVAELRLKMNHWQKSQKSLYTGELVKTLKDSQKLQSSSQLTQPLLDKIEETEEEHKEQVNQNKTQDSVDTSTQAEGVQKKDSSTGLSLLTSGNSLMEKLTRKVQEKRSQIGEQIKMGQLKDMLNDNDPYFFEKSKELKKQLKNLGCLARVYLSLKKKYSNQITFIDDLERAHIVKSDMEKGKRKIHTELELAMISDINIYYTVLHKKSGGFKADPKLKNRLGIKKFNDELKLENMRKTQNFLRFGNLIASIWGGFLECLLTNMSTFAYLMMIISMILNAGIISIIFPFAVFGYALLEEARPGKDFWRYMIIYSIIIIFIKFIFNLEAIQNQTQLMADFHEIDAWIMTGLRYSEGITGLLLYVLPEIMIIGFIMGHIYYEHLIGLYETREIDVETIIQARQRFLNSFNEPDREKLAQMRREAAQAKLAEVEENSNSDEVAILTTDIKQFVKECGIDFKKAKEYVTRSWNSEQFAEQRKEGNLDLNLLKSWEAEDRPFPTLFQQKRELAEEVTACFDPKYFRQQSNIDRKDRLLLIGKTYKQQRKERENVGIIRQYFSKMEYFKRLFPKIKEQKPGVDYYAQITLIQFITCIYLINSYTYIDARGTQNLENSNLFSFYMVIVLFIQILVMILERYVARTNIMVNIKKAGGKKEVETDEQIMQSMKTSTLGETVKSITMHLQTQKTGETILFDKDQKGASKQTQDIMQIELQKTRMTPQQVTKYTIQWILLILYHILIFWIFPLNSNDAIYGKPYCDEKSTNFEKYGCYSFTRNFYLIMFYIIFCAYFTLSAFQIRYGLPDFKEPSSLTRTIGLGHMIKYRIFYHAPFLLELKVVLDWCWTKTSLDVTQWLELAEIDSELFFFRNGNAGYFKRKLGERIFAFEKWLCGCFCLGVILFFLVGPFLMFSNLSYIAVQNLVEDAQVDITLKIFDQTNQENYRVPIFQTANPLSMDVMEEGEFISRNYHTNPETKFFMPNQVQLVKMRNVTDNEWGVSEGYKESLAEYLNAALYQTPGIIMTLDLKYQFKRPGPVESPITYGNNTWVLDFFNPQHLSLLQQFHDAMVLECYNDAGYLEPSREASIELESFIPYELRMGESKTVVNMPSQYENGTLTYSCANFWSLNVNDQGLVFITFSDLISGDFLSATSIMAFYLGVAFSVGSILRSIVVYNADRIFITDCPDPEPVRNLIRCIFLQRLEQNLEKEEELFFILFEILRSPEMFRAICGSCLRAPLITQKVSDDSKKNLRQQS